MELVDAFKRNSLKDTTVVLADIGRKHQEKSNWLLTRAEGEDLWSNNKCVRVCVRETSSTRYQGDIP